MKLENTIYCGDNLYWILRLPDEFVDLCYIDPPFFSNRNYEVIFKDGEEIRSFEDRWKGGLENYIEWMKVRVEQIHRLLKPTGSFYLHCDWHASHYLKVMCDEIFGISNFRNEIIWRRTTSHGDWKQGAKHYGRVHDTILFYSKSDDFIWNTQFIPFSDEQKRKQYNKHEPDGRLYRLVTPTGKKPGGNTEYEWKGVKPPSGRYWAYTPEKMAEMDNKGLLYYSRSGQPYIKYYFEDRPGVAIQSTWMDIPPMSPTSKERLGYPTQKPEALLGRIIRASSNQGDLVFDCFCACGTTLSVAQQLGRRWLGIDVSPSGCKLVQHRLNKLGIIPEIVGLPRTDEELKNLSGVEFQNWILGAMGGRVADKISKDMGIDGYTFYGLWGEKEYPVQVKKAEKAGRPVVDAFETAMRRKGHNKGYIVAFGFSKDAHEEVARAKSEGFEIELVSVRDIKRKFFEA